MPEQTPQEVEQAKTATTPNPDTQDGQPDTKLTKEYVDALERKKREANAEAKANRERAEKLDAELKTYQDRDKTEQQKAAEEVTRLRKDADDSRAELGRQSRLNAAMRAGAADPDYVAWKIEQAGPDAKAEEVIEGLRKSQPGLFAAPTAPAPKPAPVAAGGGSPPPVSNKSKQEQLESIRGELKSRRGQMMVGDNLVRVTQLTRAASQLERELRSGS